MPLREPWFQLAELFDHLENVVAWIKDRAGRYVWVNRAFLLDYESQTHGDGGSRATVIGKTDFELSPLFLAEQYRLDDEYVLAGNRLVNRIERVGPAEGPTVWNVTNKIPLVDAKGIVIGTAGHTQELGGNDRRGARDDGFSVVLEFMRDHFDAPISNARLARLAHMSVRAFERKFQTCFHLTPQKYLRSVQLRMASRALVYTEKPLAEVADSCGFADQSHFTREFRRHFGRTPRDYRAYYAHRDLDAAPVPNTAAEDQ